MQFTHPEFLYALTAVLIPVIIHLFNFRRYKKILFSNINLLKNITIETKKQNKLKHLLVLLARMLIIIFIVLAFAGPYFHNAESDKIHSGASMIYLDNSLSMKADGNSGRIFDEALRQSLQLVKKSPKDERFYILTNDFFNRLSFSDKPESSIILEKTILNNRRTMLSSIIKKQKRVALKNKLKNYRSFLFSDFQKNQSDIKNTSFDTSAFYYFFPYHHKIIHNLYIDSCWFKHPDLLPNKQVQLKVRVFNASASPMSKISLKLYIDGKQRALAGINIAAHDYTIVSLGFAIEKKGWHKGRIQIEDFPITFDNKLLFSFFVHNKINVLEIKENNSKNIDYLQVFYSSDSIFNFTSALITELNNLRFSKFNLIILNGLQSVSSGLTGILTDFVKNGGRLLVIPAINSQPLSINKLLSKFKAGSFMALDTVSDRVIGIKKHNSLFKNVIFKIPENVDFPTVHKHFPLKYDYQSGVQTLISLLNGNDFVSSKTFGIGKVFIFSTPLNTRFSNLTGHPLFTVLLYGIATQGLHNNKLYYTVGKDENIILNNNLPNNNDEALKVVTQDKKFNFIPMQHRQQGKLILSLTGGIKKAGFYKLISKDTLYRLLAFNLDRKESEMIFYNRDELDSLLKTTNITHYKIADNTEKFLKEVINSPQKANRLWKLFIIFALFMLLIEILILRFWK